MNLYLTADQIDQDTGGGKVTFHESHALYALGGKTIVLSRNNMGLPGHPFGQDRIFHDTVRLRFSSKEIDDPVKLVHCYAGCLTDTVILLQSLGARVGYTAAAHHVETSRKAHQELGLPFDYPHLTDKMLWEKYVGGYRASDVLVCPSQHSANCMREYGCKQRLEVIPHGVDLPREVKALPDKPFTIGYMGAVSPDKGVIDLLGAWNSLGYSDGSKLVIAGSQSRSILCQKMIQAVVKDQDTVQCIGWVEKLEDFFSSIHLYSQPSRSEGFGLEVLEAMAHGRPVLCSTGAGASDLVPAPYRYPARNAAELAEKIDAMKRGLKVATTDYPSLWAELAKDYTWEKIRQRYVEVWKSL